MESVGLEAEYRPTGGLERYVDDDRVKIIAGGGGSVHFDDFHSITSGGLIWGVSENLAMFDEVSSPPEKFDH